MSTNYFTLQRQSLFIQRQFSVYQNKWMVAVAAIVGLLLIASIGTALINPFGLYETLGFHQAVFFFGGLILTSQIFSELHSPHKSYSLLTLPASTLEKLLGSWLITSPLYILSFWTISFFIFCLSFLVAGQSIAFSQFFSEEMLEPIASYMVFQTIFLWGACYFRKNNFLKTFLALIGLIIVVAMYTGLMGYLILNHHGLTFTSDDSQVLNKVIENKFLPAIEFLFWAAVGPFILLLSYFTLKEREV